MRTSYAVGFAEVYDRHYANFAQSAARAIHRLHETTREPGRIEPYRLLDLCCGAGQLMRYFADRGYEAIGVDRAPAMLEKARGNAGPHLDSGAVEFHEADVTAYLPSSPVDLVTSTFDALNHLPDFAALEAVFARAAEGLAPGGMFVFDLHTLRGIRSLNHIHVRDDEDLLMVSRINHDPENNRAFAHISGVYQVPEQPNWMRFDQHASVTAWSVGDVLSALKRAGFSSSVPSTLDRLGEPLTDPESNPRLFYVARKWSS